MVWKKIPMVSLIGALEKRTGQNASRNSLEKPRSFFHHATIFRTCKARSGLMQDNRG
jgi:hypothetical protein